jgi:hypothetical protein
MDENDIYGKLSLNEMLDGIIEISDGIQNYINYRMLDDINKSTTISANSSLDYIHGYMQAWGSDFTIFNWLGNVSYRYLNFLAMQGGLSNWSYNYVITVYKSNLAAQLTTLLAQSEVTYTYGLFYDYSFVDRWIMPRIKETYDKAVSFRNSIILSMENIDKAVIRNKDDIDNMQKQIASLNTTFNDRVDNLIEVWFESWYAYWDWWYKSQWETLVDELVSFKTEYDLFIENAQVVIDTVEQQSVDLEDIKKRLKTPFSNVYELKETDNDAFTYQLHLLKELVIEALALDFPSVRETMIENLDTILGIKQQQKISEEKSYERPTEPRR